MSGRRTPGNWSGADRDISTGVQSEGSRDGAGERGSSSEKKRSGFETRVRARHDGQPEWQPRIARSKVLGQSPSGGKVQEGVRERRQRRIARTMSEHLTPFPIVELPFQTSPPIPTLIVIILCGAVLRSLYVAIYRACPNMLSCAC